MLLESLVTLGGGLGILNSSDKICSDNESLKGGLDIRNRIRAIKDKLIKVCGVKVAP